MPPVVAQLGNAATRPPTAAAVVQIAPPVEGGVRDYMEALKVQWDRLGPATSVLPASKSHARAAPLEQHLEHLAPAAAGPCVLILHFSGYGYAPRGLCFWLVDEIRALRASRRGSLRVVVVFHELFASGRPWQSAFWLGGLQAAIARRIALAADALWTNTEAHARWLRQVVGPGVPVEMRPVFSNIGEPPVLPAWSERRSSLVVFGAAATRHRAMLALSGHSRQLRAMGVDEVLEIGPGAAAAQRVGPLKHQFLGRLPAQEVAGVLQSARFALLDYPAHCLGKSSVFAAYAACGNAVLNSWPAAPDADGVRSGCHYLRLTEVSTGGRAAVAPADMATALHSWYRSHPLALQARELLALVRI